MKLQELFSKEAEQVLGYLGRLAVLVLSPRRYLADGVDEQPTKMASRLVTYVIVLNLFQMVIVFAAVRGAVKPTLGLVLGFSVYTAAIACLWVPVFWLIARILSAHKALKTSINYTFSAQALFAAPVVILYGLFLLTEDYTFAALKGVAAYLYLLTYVLVFPIALTSSLRQRLKALVVSLGCAFVMLLLVEVVFTPFGSRSSELERFSILYDPIGDEVSQVNVDIGENTWTRELRRVLQDAKNLHSDGEKWSHEGIVESSHIREWPVTRKRLGDEWDKERSVLTEKRSSAKFSRTRRIIDLRLAEIEASEHVAIAMDELVKTGSAAAGRDLKDKLQEYQKTMENGMKYEIEFYSTRKKLIRLNLLTSA